MANSTSWQSYWAPMLVDELLKHNPVQAMQIANPLEFEGVKQQLLEDLTAMELEEDNIFGFQVKLPEKDYLVCDGSEVCHTLTPRRILLTDKAREYQFGALGHLLAKIADAAGGFSSDAWVRRIRENSELARELVHAKSPFALLSKYEVVDASTPGKEEFSTYPLLTVPGLTGSEALKSWENSCRPKPRTEKVSSLRLL